MPHPRPKEYIFRRKFQDEIIEISAADGYDEDDKPSIPMHARVLSGSQQLLFDLTAKPNQIDIHSCVMTDTATGHLKAFENYLDIRGFNSSTVNFLFNFVWKQIPNEHILRVVRSFYGTQQSDNVSSPYLVPDGFPFEIVDGCGDNLLFLVRHFEDEIIKARVELPCDGELAAMRSVVYCESAFRINVDIDRGGFVYQFSY